MAKRELKTRTEKLVKELKAATDTAAELARQVADGIRAERKAGLQFVSSQDPSRRKASSRKKR